MGNGEEMTPSHDSTQQQLVEYHCNLFYVITSLSVVKDIQTLELSHNNSPELPVVAIDQDPGVVGDSQSLGEDVEYEDNLEIVSGCSWFGVYALATLCYS